MNKFASKFVHSHFQLFGDGWFLGDMDQYLRLRFAQKPSAPTYSFLYTHEGASSFTEYYQGDAETNYGAILS